MQHQKWCKKKEMAPEEALAKGLSSSPIHPLQTPTFIHKNKMMSTKTILFLIHFFTFSIFLTASFPCTKMLVHDRTIYRVLRDTSLSCQVLAQFLKLL